MKNYTKLFAVILFVTLIFSVSSIFFGVSAEVQRNDETIGENDESADTDVVADGAENTEESENFFEAFASMFKEFHPMGFVENLRFMGIGMLGIFIIIGIIVVATVVINKAFSGTAKKED